MRIYFATLVMFYVVNFVKISMFSRSFIPNFGQWPFPTIAGKSSVLVDCKKKLLLKRLISYWSSYMYYSSHQRREGATIRNRYNQVPHLTQDITWEVTRTQFNTTNESQEVGLFPAGDHKAAMYRRESVTSTRQ